MIQISLASDISAVSSPPRNTLVCGDVEQMLDLLPEKPIFDLVVTSPPYNMGKAYEQKMTMEKYFQWQGRIIKKIASRLKENGSICWQVGNHVAQGTLYPLDLGFAPIFSELGMKLRNRIIWHYGHGLHCKRRFSGRYEVILWYTKSDQYTFNLDEVRVPAKYPEKKHFKGEKKGQLSGNPLGKNPEDVWDIPNVKANHVEKTIHPCQFPVGLAERLVLALSDEGQLIFDPFCGVASSGVAALLHNRIFWGCEQEPSYVAIGKERLEQTLLGCVPHRPMNKPIYVAGKAQNNAEYDVPKKEE